MRDSQLWTVQCWVDQRDAIGARMGVSRRLALWAALLSGALLGGALVVAAADRVGEPASVPGLRALPHHGCLTSGIARGCDRARALRHASWTTISPDGRNVYVGAERSNAVAVFTRDAGTGVLRQLPGRTGCWSEEGRDGCAAGRGLHLARPIAISGDGRSVYAGTLDGVAVFHRDRRTGAIRQLDGAEGCVADRPLDKCAQGRALTNVRALTVAPGGRYLYVAARGSDAITVFARSLPSGALQQLPGPAGCVSQNPIEGCASGRGLDGGRGVVLSPDRRFVYVAAEDGDALAVFARDPVTGGLTQLPGRAGCLQRLGADGCAPLATLRSPHHLVLSSDGRFAYVASDTIGAVVVLRRSAHTGQLVPVTGRGGCISSPPRPDCRRGLALGGAHSLALAPSGRVLYAVGRRDHALAVLARDPVSGGLRQRGCVGRIRVRACAPAPGLRGVHSVAVSADGRYVYVASELADAVVTLATQRR